MSATFTESWLAGVELTGLVTISETKLQKNFQSVLRCLKDHGDKINGLETALIEEQKKVAQLERRQLEAKADAARMEQELIKRCQNLSEKITEARTLTEESFQRNHQSIGHLCQQLRLSSCLYEQRFQRTESTSGDLDKQHKQLKAQTERIDVEAEKMRKQAATTFLKADSAFKKTRILQEKMEVVQDKTIRTLNEVTAIRQIFPVGTLNNREQQEAIRQEMMVIASGAANRSSVRVSSMKNPLVPNRFAGISQFSGIAGQSSESTDITINQPAVQNIKQQLQQIKRRLMDLEVSGKDDVGRVLERLSQELSDVRNVKNEVKRQLQKQRAQNGMDAINERIQQLRPEILRLGGRIDVTEDRNYAIQRKLEEARRNVTQLTVQVKEHGAGRCQQRLRLAQADLLAQLRDITTKLEGKVGCPQFSREQQLNKHRWRELSDLLSVKCDKLQVKKALLFIEAKIKQIILVISEDEQNEREALLSKKQLKCASCDKDLDRLTGLVNNEGRHWNMLPTKELQSDNLGKYGISRYGSLAKKLRKLQGSDLPVLRGGRKGDDSK